MKIVLNLVTSIKNHSNLCMREQKNQCMLLYISGREFFGYYLIAVDSFECYKANSILDILRYIV